MKTNCWLIFLAAMLPLSALAGNESFIFFDLKNCTSGAAENEPLTNEPLTGEKVYEEWRRKASDLNGESDNKSPSEWSVYYTSETKIGLCKTSLSPTHGMTEVSCREESLNGFELAGARFVAERNKMGHLLRFKCASGCKTITPEFLYRAIESDDSLEKGPDEIALLDANREYEKQCVK